MTCWGIKIQLCCLSVSNSPPWGAPYPHLFRAALQCRPFPVYPPPSLSPLQGADLHCGLKALLPIPALSLSPLFFHRLFPIKSLATFGVRFTKDLE